jgi:hypothetical protein
MRYHPTFVLDERNLFWHSTVFSAAERESAYVLDGLLHNDVVKSDFPVRPNTIPSYTLPRNHPLSIHSHKVMSGQQTSDSVNVPSAFFTRKKYRVP